MPIHCFFLTLDPPPLPSPGRGGPAEEPVQQYHGLPGGAVASGVICARAFIVFETKLYGDRAGGIYQRYSCGARVCVALAKLFCSAAKFCLYAV